MPANVTGWGGGSVPLWSRQYLSSCWLASWIQRICQAWHIRLCHLHKSPLLHPNMLTRSLLLIWFEWLFSPLTHTHTHNLKACPRSNHANFSFGFIFFPFILLWLVWWDAAARVLSDFYFNFFEPLLRRPAQSLSPSRTFFAGFKLGPRHLGNFRSPRGSSHWSTSRRSLVFWAITIQ